MYQPKMSFEEMRKNARLLLTDVKEYIYLKITNSFTANFVGKEKEGVLCSMNFVVGEDKVIDQIKNYLKKNYKFFLFLTISEKIGGHFFISVSSTSDDTLKFIETYNSANAEVNNGTPKDNPTGIQMTADQVFASFKQLINDLGGRSGSNENHFDRIGMLPERGQNGEVKVAIYHNNRNEQMERTLNLLLELSMECDYKTGNNTLYTFLIPNQNYRDLLKPEHKTFFPAKEVLAREIQGKIPVQQPVIAKPVTIVEKPGQNNIGNVAVEKGTEVIGSNNHQPHFRKGSYSKNQDSEVVQVSDQQQSPQVKMAIMAISMVPDADKTALVGLVYEALSGTDKLAFIAEYGKALITDETEIERRIQERLEKEKIDWEKDYAIKYENELRSQMRGEVYDDIKADLTETLTPKLKSQLRDEVKDAVKKENYADLKTILEKKLGLEYFILPANKPLELGTSGQSHMVIKNTITAKELVGLLPK